MNSTSSNSNRKPDIFKGHLSISKKTLKIFLAAIMIIGFGTIAAYLIDADTATNTVTIGGNRVEIVEDFDPPKELTAGVSFKKEPAVKNTGSVPCYVRMFAESSDSDVDKFLTIDFNTADWTEKQSDGYYYYKKILDVGETTSPLFTTVSFSDDAPESALKDFNIIIYTESYQSHGFDSYIKAWENYEKNKGV